MFEFIKQNVVSIAAFFIFNPSNLAARVFDARLARANLMTKIDFDIILKKISDRVTLNKTKHLLVETELKKIKYF